MCQYCNSNRITNFVTYKLIWHSCNDCGLVTKSLRLKYPLDTNLIKLIRKILNIFPGGKSVSRLFLKLIKHETSVDVYSKYSDMLYNNPDQLKLWDESSKQNLNLIKKVSSDLSKEKLLIFSGGPGVFCKLLLPQAGELIATEYNPQTVQAMNEILGVKTIVFDCNNLTKDFKKKVGTADIIWAEHLAPFSQSIIELIRYLKDLLKPGGHLIIDMEEATLGYMLYWQLAEGSPNTFMPKQIFENIISDVGGLDNIFEETYEYNIFTYRIPTLGAKVFYFLPFWFYYLLRGLPKLGKIRSLKNKRTLYIFQKAR